VKEETNEKKPARVAQKPKQAGEARDRWWWVERSVWTERMLTRLTSGGLADRIKVCAPWAAEFDSGTPVEAYNRGNTNPLTGEPEAGNPPVRFGGRGKV